MARIQTTCPRCRQPIIADVEQLFDLNVDPQAKQKLLTGAVNVARCQSCGYEGPLSTPIVYHDPEKELLLTYFPSELGVPLNEQEKTLGPLVMQVTNRLPNEKKKAYLLQPKSMFTYQTLMETILAADGITKEMLDDQQKKINLLQRLITTSPETRVEIIKQESALIDESFFMLLARYLEAAAAQGNKKLLDTLTEVQNALVENTEIGQKIKLQSAEMEAALKDLQEASKDGLTREKLLDLLINAPTDIRLSTIVSYTRSGMDYSFFQLLTDKIEQSQGDEKEELTELRKKLLEMTEAIDKRLDEELIRARKLLETILSSGDIEKAIEENLDQIDEFFNQALKTALEDARQRGDLERSAKINQVILAVEKASAPPPEVALIEKFLAANDEAELISLVEENAAAITPEFLQILNSIVAQSGEGSNPEITQRLQNVYAAVMKASMKAKVK
jgi:hypothetical protein